MQESKDPAIKLFGRKIALADGDSAVVYGDDLAFQASEKEVDEEELETEKVQSVLLRERNFCRTCLLTGESEDDPFAKMLRDWVGRFSFSNFSIFLNRVCWHCFSGSIFCGFSFLLMQTVFFSPLNLWWFW